MSASDDYRRFAAACLEFSGASVDEQIRAIFIQMAQVWFRLAVEHEKEANIEIAD